MKLHLERIYTCPTYTIGHLYQIFDDGERKLICDTIEDTDRRLDDSMEVSDIKKIKVMSRTAIPTGTYDIAMNVVSPKYSKKEYYKDFCGGYLPRLMNVKGFDGILIHIGNTAEDSGGCLLVGYNKVKGKIINSTTAFEDLMKNYFFPAKYKEEEVTIKITRKYK